ncbi:MAG: response regulator [Desulforhopalus sp.]
MAKNIQARVLLVDDEEEFVRTLAERLEIRGLKVTGATSGKEAIELTDRQEFDAIIVDLAMPGMDGLSTLKHIKTLHPDTGIIMLSGQGTVKTSTEAMKLGAEDFLEKPVNIDELLDKISDARKRRIVILQKRSKKEIENILKRKFW